MTLDDLLGEAGFPAASRKDWQELARKALELDSSNAGAHAVLAEIYLGRQQYDLARAENEKAIAQQPKVDFAPKSAVPAAPSAATPAPAPAPGK